MNKTLVISGASKGIGLATAQLFFENGYRVINLSRTSCSIPATINLAVDLLDLDWPTQWGDLLLEKIGDSEQVVLIHNAAMLTKESVRNIDAQNLRDVLQLNVVAAAQLNTLVIPAMRDGSSIVYVSSTLGTKAVANTHAYVVSKHAVLGQMRATCQDLAGSLIHTAAVCPGFTETEMLKDHLAQHPDVYKQIVATVAQGRLVQPSEIADALWFCSQNPVINGAVIDANLGQIER